MNKLNLPKYFGKYWFLYLIATIAMVAGTMLDMVAPKIVQHITDDVLVAHKMDLLTPLLL